MNQTSTGDRTGTGDLLLADARAILAREIARVASNAPLEEALAAWVIPEWDSPSSPLNAFHESIVRLSDSRDYRDVAAAGFWAAHLARQRMAPPEPLVEAFSRELEWLTGRPYQLSNGNYAGFFSDAPALLGLALGARHGGTESAKGKISDWLRAMLPMCSQRRGIEDWELCLLAATSHVCGLENLVPVPTGADAGAAVISLSRCKAFPTLSEQDVARIEEEVLKQLLSTTVCQATGAQATFLAAAHDWVRRAATMVIPGRATVADVASVLRGIQASLHRWTWEEKKKTPNSQARKWHIENEYHVQNLLWIVLRPMFPDLEDEFYAEAIGQKRPRADIGIPSLRLIIEAKFMRASASPQDMIGEIAEDTGLYLTSGFPYDAIIPFIWDNVPRPQEHDVMRQGMMKMQGIADVVIISRPNMMVLEQSSVSTATTAADADSADPSTESTPL